jgi:hypothetical protein
MDLVVQVEMLVMGNFILMRQRERDRLVETIQL